MCRARGEAVLAYLERLYRQFGFYASSQKTIALAAEGGGATALMGRLRQNPPTRIGDRAVRARRDYAIAGGSLPPSDVLGYDLESGTRVIVRPSGTEPKVKCYIDHREPLAPGEALAAAERRAHLVMSAIGTAIVELLQPKDLAP